MSTPDVYQAALERVSRVPGVRGALIVDLAAGVPVVSEIAADVDGGAVAALAASMFGRTDRALTTAELGKMSTLQLEADDGHVIAGDAGELIVVAVTERNAQLGLVRLEVHRAAQGLR